MGHQDSSKKLSMVEAAYIVLQKEQKPLAFNEIFERVSQLKNWNETEKQNNLSQFYTELNFDGRFVTNGANTWGLKNWYRIDQVDIKDMVEEDDVEMSEEMNSEEDLDHHEDLTTGAYGEYTDN